MSADLLSFLDGASVALAIVGAVFCVALSRAVDRKLKDMGDADAD